jgi:hypothetical protein
MTDSNCGPSWSKATRWLVAVFALKNASQLVVTAVMAAVPPVDPDAEVAGDDTGGADVGGGADDELLDALGLLPPHAVARTASPASARAPTRCNKCR